MRHFLIYENAAVNTMILRLVWFLLCAKAFVIQSRKGPTRALWSTETPKDLQKVPLLPVPKDATFPLPTADLPRDLTALNRYKIPLEIPLHRSIVDYAMEQNSLVGHVVDSIAIGAIGCITTIESKAEEYTICQGKWRFQIEEILQEIPFPVVSVSKLQDEELSFEDRAKFQELVPQVAELLADYCLLELSDNENMSPLEKSILEPVVSADTRRALLQQRTSVAQRLLQDPHFVNAVAVTFVAAEILDWQDRETLIQSTNPLQRMQLVFDNVKEKVGMKKASNIAASITNEADEESKDLQVGAPTLPQWAFGVKPGATIEYYWNEEFGWCRGTVTEEPVQIMDEILITVLFEDGETHQLPLTAEEKVRWRPARDEFQFE